MPINVRISNKGKVGKRTGFFNPILHKSLTQKEWLSYNKNITGVDLSVYFGDPDELTKKYNAKTFFDYVAANEKYNLKVIRINNKPTKLENISVETYRFKGIHKGGIRPEGVNHILYSTSVIVVPYDKLDFFLTHIKQKWEKYKNRESLKEKKRREAFLSKKKMIDDEIENAIENIKKYHKWEEYKNKLKEIYPYYKFDVEEEFLTAKKIINQLSSEEQK